MSLSHIILGGAQFSGFAYGAHARLLDRAEVFRLLDVAWDLGIRSFDTAEGYGAGAERLEDYLRSRKRLGEAQVSTKVTPGRGLGLRLSGASARFFGAAAVFTMTHGTVSGADFQLCRRNVLSRLGQSVYTIVEAAQAVRQGTSFIQLPLDVFIQPIEALCHVRSVFSAGSNVSADPVAQLRSALGRLRPQDRLVVGVSSEPQLRQLASAFA